MSAFVVESNKIRLLSSFAPNDDIEVLASPFLDQQRPVEEQLKTVLGKVSELADEWNPADGATGADGHAPEGYHYPLTVLGTGNSLFLDYHPHNPGVFSLHDDLTWPGQQGSATSANVSYVVFGFFAQDSQSLASPSTDAIKVQVCHGAASGIHYRSDQSPVEDVARVAAAFHKEQPVAVGDDPLDALTTMLADSSDPRETAMSSSLLLADGAFAIMETNSQLERAESATTNFKGSHGGFRWRVATVDEKQQQQQQQGDSSDTTQPRQPTSQELTEAQIRVLRELNDAQRYLDALVRRKRYIKHLVFCEWWKHRSLEGDMQPLAAQRRAHAKGRGRHLLAQLETVSRLIWETAAYLAEILELEKLHGPFTQEKSAKFFSHTDPAIVLRDIGSGWPDKWGEEEDLGQEETEPGQGSDARDLDLVKQFRDRADIVKTWLREMVGEVPEGAVLPEEARTFFTDSAVLGLLKPDHALVRDAKLPYLWRWLRESQGLAKLPEMLRDALLNVMTEFTYTRFGAYALPDRPQPFFQSEDPQRPYRQPWRPIFVEWELEYADIPQSLWELRHDDDGTVHYGIRSAQKPLTAFGCPSRRVSGRTVLQQSLGAIVQAMISTLFGKVARSSLDEALPAEARAAILAYVNDHISKNTQFGRLGGFTDHLLTLCQGAHVIPTPESEPTADLSHSPPSATVQQAATSNEETSFFFSSQDEISMLLEDNTNAESAGGTGGLDVTPYGTTTSGHLYSALAAAPAPRQRQPWDTSPRLFRPVTHGQARFTAFNIVDRFGQVICGVLPGTASGQQQQLLPHVSPGMSCEPLATTTTTTTTTTQQPQQQQQPNTVRKLDETHARDGSCPWFQIPPRINQDARVNASFMLPDDSSSSSSSSKGAGWRPAGAGENAIVAWLLVNFHNRSLQVYAADGHFVAEAFLPERGHTKVYWQTPEKRGAAGDVFAPAVEMAAKLGGGRGLETVACFGDNLDVQGFVGGADNDSDGDSSSQFSYEDLLADSVSSTSSLGEEQDNTGPQQGHDQQSSDPGILLLSSHLQQQKAKDPKPKPKRMRSKVMTMEDLLAAMSSVGFLRDLWGVVTRALEHAQAPGGQYSALPSSALVGRPIALANLGLGLELATAPMRSQAYADIVEQQRLEDPQADAAAETTGDEELSRYEFGVKLGDMLGVRDGLVGYFGWLSEDRSDMKKKPSSSWKLVTDYTHRDCDGDDDDDNSGNKNCCSGHVQHPTKVPALALSPAYPTVFASGSSPATPSPQARTEVPGYAARVAAAGYSSVVTALLDPFLPVHVRTAVLPVARAQLDRAVVDREVRRLGVWLRAGPVLIGARSHDPVIAAAAVGPVADSSADASSAAAVSAAAERDKPRVPVQTPAGDGTEFEWKWIQPVAVDELDKQRDDEQGGEGSVRDFVDDGVKYLDLDVMLPLKTGFDAAVAPDARAVRETGAADTALGDDDVGSGVAVALEGYLLQKLHRQDPA